MHDEPKDIEFGVGPVLRTLRLADEARHRGDRASAEYLKMTAQFAANRERNRIKRYRVRAKRKE